MLVVAAFYRFFKLDAVQKIQSELEQIIETTDIYGTILLAVEGINGTICGSRKHIDTVRSFFAAHGWLDDMEYKESTMSEKNPFIRRHIKIKKEIVTLGEPHVDVQERTGHHVDARRWDQLLSDPSVFVVDVRNDYETSLGSFIGAHDPALTNFREFPAYVKNNLDPAVHKKIAMSCTGGIRCEKASSYLLNQGFTEVYQLKGGVLRYLEDTPKDHSKWRGECFVFDNRVTVDHDLQPGSYTLCFSCRAPLSADDKQSPHYIEAVTCPHCYEQTPQKKQRSQERHMQVQLALARGETHLGRQAMRKKSYAAAV